MATPLGRAGLLGAVLAVAGLIGFPLWFTWIAEAYLAMNMYLAGDFITYWAGAQRLLAGRPLYSPAQLSGPYLLPDMDYGAGYVYPPTAAALSSPLGFAPIEASWAFFAAVGLVGLGTVVYQIARRERVPRAAALFIVCLVMTSGPVAQAALSGNVNLWVAAGLGLVWLRSSLATPVAVTGALVKLFPGAVVLWAIRSRTFSWRAIGVGCTIVLVTTAWVGIDQWRDFATSTVNARPFGADLPQSPRVTLEPLLGSALATLVGYALCAVLGVATLIVRSDRLAFLCLSFAMIVPATEWHLHYLLIPLVGAVPLMATATSRALAWVAGTSLPYWHDMKPPVTTGEAP